jgi:hypothetical protein
MLPGASCPSPEKSALDGRCPECRDRFCGKLSRLGDAPPAGWVESPTTNDRDAAWSEPKRTGDRLLTISKPVRERDRNHPRFVASGEAAKPQTVQAIVGETPTLSPAGADAMPRVSIDGAARKTRRRRMQSRAELPGNSSPSGRRFIIHAPPGLTRSIEIERAPSTGAYQQ